ncbi:MAG: hypothetical protein ACLVJ6_15560 [Merdibacter sp.]
MEVVIRFVIDRVRRRPSQDIEGIDIFQDRLVADPGCCGSVAALRLVESPVYSRPGPIAMISPLGC